MAVSSPPHKRIWISQTQTVGVSSLGNEVSLKYDDEGEGSPRIVGWMIFSSVVVRTSCKFSVDLRMKGIIPFRPI